MEKIKNPNRQLAKKLKIQVFDCKLFPIVLWGIPKDTNRPLSRKIVMDHLLIKKMHVFAFKRFQIVL